MPPAVGRENASAVEAEVPTGGSLVRGGGGSLREPAGRPAAPHTQRVYGKSRLSRPRLIATVTAVALLAGACGSGLATSGRTTDTASTMAKTAVPSSVLQARRLPISVQTNNQMLAARNYGPSSSVLLPHACQLRGGTVTATGSYHGGFAPDIYDRVGDIVVLYVFTSPTSGFPEGITLAASSARTSPPMTGGTWRVSTSVPLVFGSPERCVVAARPTHDWIGAP
jgi:hypothetical protein